MTVAMVYLTGVGLGLVLSAVFFLGIQRRLTARVLRHTHLEALSANLEHYRKQARTEPTEEVGHSLFAVRPGALEKSHSQRKQLDSQ